MAEDIARNLDSLAKTQLPFPSSYQVALMDTAGDVTRKVQDIMTALDVQWRFRPTISTGVGMVTRNVWSRSARRGNKQ